jgi:hypothetical protein
VAGDPASGFHASVEIASTWVWSVQTLITWSYKVPKPNKYMYIAQRSIVRACYSPSRRKRACSCQDLVVQPTSFSPTAFSSDHVSYRHCSDMKAHLKLQNASSSASFGYVLSLHDFFLQHRGPAGALFLEPLTCATEPSIANSAI